MATPINNNTTSLQDLLAKANALPEAGTKLPALTTPGAAADLREGKQLIDGDGNVVDGSMPDVEVPTAELALLNSTGTIYANVQQSAGYTPGGTTTTQLDLPVQEGKTVTPTKSKQVAVSAGKWCTESVEVGPIPEEYIVPSGTLEVTENGTHDVTGYAYVNVTVPTEDLNTVLTEQDALITELEAALEGKAAGGGGSVDTCTVSTTTGLDTIYICYDNGETGVHEDAPLTSSKHTISVAKDSILVVEMANYTTPLEVTGSATLLHSYYSTYTFYVTGDCTLVSDNSSSENGDEEA